MTTSDNPYPTGQEMIERNKIHYEQVKLILPDFPSTRGDDLDLWVTGLRKFYWRQVKIVQEPKGGALTIRFNTRADLYNVPMPESYRRRRQEIQHDEKESIWMRAAASLHWPDYLDEEWRKLEVAQKEFAKLAKGNPYLPTDRVVRKRRRNCDAQTHNYGSGQLSLNDRWERD